jgi:Kef-type K+ transport system membrane component KefB
MIRIPALALVIVCMLLALFAFEASVVLPTARSTMTFGFMLLAAYLVGDVLSLFRLPKITGYIAAGILFGPYLLGLVSTDTVEDLKLIDDLALTFIALAAGGELRLQQLRERKRTIGFTVFFLTLLVSVGVALFTLTARPLLPYLDGKPTIHLLAVAALLGALAVARSP